MLGLVVVGELRCGLNAGWSSAHAPHCGVVNVVVVVDEEKNGWRRSKVWARAQPIDREVVVALVSHHPLFFHCMSALSVFFHRIQLLLVGACTIVVGSHSDDNVHLSDSDHLFRLGYCSSFCDHPSSMLLCVGGFEPVHCHRYDVSSAPQLPPDDSAAIQVSFAQTFLH